MFVCLPPRIKERRKVRVAAHAGGRRKIASYSSAQAHVNSAGTPTLQATAFRLCMGQRARAHVHIHTRERTRASERERKREGERVCERESIRAHMHKAHQLAPTVISWLRKPRTQTTSSCRHQRQSQHTAPVADVISFVRLLNPKPLSNPKP